MGSRVKLILIGGIAVVMLCLIFSGIWLYRRHKRKQRISHPSLSIGNLHDIGKRSTQQDSFCISDFQNTDIYQNKGCMAVLADGMGGLYYGAELSALISASLLQSFDKAVMVQDEYGFLDDLLQFTYSQVNVFLQRSEKPCGSTLLLVWIWKNHLHYRSIGDSRIYLVRNQHMVQINREHTYGQQLDEAALQSGDWKETQSDQRKAVTSYLGMPWEALCVDKNAYSIQLQNDDTIALFSDGVFHTLSEKEILTCMIENDPYISCEQLYNGIHEKQKTNQDNYTAIIIRYRQMK